MNIASDTNTTIMPFSSEVVRTSHKFTTNTNIKNTKECALKGVFPIGHFADESFFVILFNSGQSPFNVVVGDVIAEVVGEV